MPLSAIKVRNLKPTDKVYKLSDEKGLFVEVRPSGGRYWRFKFRYLGKEKLLSLGVYPDVSLAQARESRDEARKLLAQGVDPCAARLQAKADRLLATATSFEAVAREWHKQHTGVKSSTAARILRCLEKDVFPVIGAKPIADITRAVMKACLQKIEARGVHYTASKTREYGGHPLADPGLAPAHSSA